MAPLEVQDDPHSLEDGVHTRKAGVSMDPKEKSPKSGQPSLSHNTPTNAH